jgi:predicted Abi (CAAX) family protease
MNLHESAFAESFISKVTKGTSFGIAGQFQEPYAKDYSFAIYNFAQLLLRNGQTCVAKRYATQAYELSTRRETLADRDLAAALLKEWPEIVENR